MKKVILLSSFVFFSSFLIAHDQFLEETRKLTLSAKSGDSFLNGGLILNVDKKFSGPFFEEINEKLQKSLLEYLENQWKKRDDKRKKCEDWQKKFEESYSIEDATLMRVKAEDVKDKKKQDRLKSLSPEIERMKAIKTSVLLANNELNQISINLKSLSKMEEAVQDFLKLTYYYPRAIEATPIRKQRAIFSKLGPRSHFEPFQFKLDEQEFDKYFDQTNEQESILNQQGIDLENIQIFHNIIEFFNMLPAYLKDKVAEVKYLNQDFLTDFNPDKAKHFNTSVENVNSLEHIIDQSKKFMENLAQFIHDERDKEPFVKKYKL